MGVYIESIKSRLIGVYMYSITGRLIGVYVCSVTGNRWASIYAVLRQANGRLYI
jgi:hypothetical protein